MALFIYSSAKTTESSGKENQRGAKLASGEVSVELGIQGDMIILHDMIRLLPKIRNKYWKLGKKISVIEIPKDLKDSYYSLGNEIDEFLKLSKMLGTIDEPKNN